LGLAVKRFGGSIAFDDEVIKTLSISLEKASIMYEEAVRKQDLIDADRKYLKSREAQLDTKEARLIDREVTLARSANEFARKVKRNGL